MIVTVTPNPAVDLTITTSAVRTGESHRIDTARRRAGGKGLNVARVLASQGHQVRALAAVGDADKEFFAEDLLGVPHQLIGVQGPTRRSYAIVDTGSNETTIFNERGVSLPGRIWRELCSAALCDLGAGDVLVISGSTPPGVRSDDIAGLIEAAHARNALVVADVTGDNLVAAAAAGVDVVKPNIDELRETFGDVDVIAGVRRLHQLGVGHVIVSLGREGMVIGRSGADSLRHGKLQSALVGNPTGAGDAAVAAIASLLAVGQASLDQCLVRAVAWSAAAVLSPVAGEIDPSHRVLADQVTLGDYACD